MARKILQNVHIFFKKKEPLRVNSGSESMQCRTRRAYLPFTSSTFTGSSGVG